VAERDDAIAGFRNRIKSLEIEAEQIEIALLVQALVRRAGRGAGGAPALPESIRRTVETVVGFFATKVATPWRTPAVDAAMNALADHAARVAAAGGGPA
jgi:hypothetical protein